MSNPQIVIITLIYNIPDTFFFFNDTATTEIYTLSLHDALPISCRAGVAGRPGIPLGRRGVPGTRGAARGARHVSPSVPRRIPHPGPRSDRARCPARPGGQRASLRGRSAPGVRALSGAGGGRGATGRP